MELNETLNKKILNIVKKISEDEQLKSEYFKLKTFKEVYEFLIKIGKEKFSEKDFLNFIKLLTKLIHDKNKFENELVKITGGNALKKRIFSSILVSLLTISSSMAKYTKNDETTISKYSKSKTSVSNDDNTKQNFFKDKLKWILGIIVSVGGITTITFWKKNKKTIKPDSNDNIIRNKVVDTQETKFFPHSIHRVEIFKPGSWLFFLEGRNFKNEWVSLERKSDTPPMFIVEKGKHYKIYLNAEERKPFTINKITDVKDTNTNGYLGESLHNAYPDTFLLKNDDKNSKTSVSTTLFKCRSKSLPPRNSDHQSQPKISIISARSNNDDISNKSSSSDSTLQKIDDNNENKENIKKFEERYKLNFQNRKKPQWNNEWIKSINVCQEDHKGDNTKFIAPQKNGKFGLDWSGTCFTTRPEDANRIYLIEFIDQKKSSETTVVFEMPADKLIKKYDQLFCWLPRSHHLSIYATPQIYKNSPSKTVNGEKRKNEATTISTENEATTISTENEVENSKNSDIGSTNETEIIKLSTSTKNEDTNEDLSSHSSSQSENNTETQFERIISPPPYTSSSHIIENNIASASTTPQRVNPTINDSNINTEFSSSSPSLSFSSTIDNDKDKSFQMKEDENKENIKKFEERYKLNFQSRKKPQWNEWIKSINVCQEDHKGDNTKFIAPQKNGKFGLDWSGTCFTTRPEDANRIYLIEFIDQKKSSGTVVFEMPADKLIKKYDQLFCWLPRSHHLLIYATPQIYKNSPSKTVNGEKRKNEATTISTENEATTISTENEVENSKNSDIGSTNETKIIKPSTSTKNEDTNEDLSSHSSSQSENNTETQFERIISPPPYTSSSHIIENNIASASTTPQRVNILTINDSNINTEFSSSSPSLSFSSTIDNDKDKSFQMKEDENNNKTINKNFEEIYNQHIENDLADWNDWVNTIDFAEKETQGNFIAPKNDSGRYKLALNWSYFLRGAKDKKYLVSLKGENITFIETAKELINKFPKLFRYLKNFEYQSYKKKQP